MYDSSQLNAYKAIVAFFFRKAWRSRRNRFFIFLCMLPLIIMGIMIVVNLFQPGFLRDIKFFLGEMTIQIYFLLNVQLFSLFFGTSVISEEVEDKTLVYLLPRPVSRTTVLLGKFSAYVAIPSLLLMAGLLASFFIYVWLANFNIPLWDSVIFLLTLWGIALLHIIGYCSLFVFLGSIMKKPVIAGIVFVFGWENLVRLLPGISRFLTLNYYLRPLLPSFNYSKNSQFLAFRITQPSGIESIIVILSFSILFIGLSAAIFHYKEIVLTDSV